MRNIRRRDKDIFLIVIANVLTHGFLFFLTGTFWDDWGYIHHNTETLWEQFMSAGIPSRAIIIRSVWNIPNYGYRWIVFFAFLAMAVLFYFILHKIPIYNDRGCLFIPLLFTTIPLNDCRVILCDVPYTIGFLFFFLGFYLLIVWFENRKIKLRVFTIICFLLSFTINSLLFFYAIVLFYIYVNENIQQKNLFKSLKRMVYYFDFIAMPFVFFVAKQILFPTYGMYENYNQINIGKLIYAVSILPLAVGKQLQIVWDKIFNWIPVAKISGAVLIMILGILIGRGALIIKKILTRDKELDITIKVRTFFASKNVCGLLLGILVFGIGMFPYLVIRGSAFLYIDGVDSRDSMLLPVGMAMIIYGFFTLSISNKRLITAFLVFVLFCGGCKFNLDYLDYQRDSYWQDALTEKFKEHPELSDKSNLLFLSDDNNGCGCTRFYSLNANAAMAYQNEKRLIMNGYGDLNLLQSDLLNIYVDEKHELLMNDYDITNKYLDGVIIYSNKISYQKTIQLKMFELFYQEKFYKAIKESGDFSYYDAESTEAEFFLQGYEYLKRGEKDE